MAAKSNNGRYERLRQQEHPHCVVCGKAVRNGLGLRFHVVRQGVVESTFACQPVLEGYLGALHGGVICALLDGAMTNCLFSLDVTAVTAELQVRFLKPVAASGWATVRAGIESSSPPLYKLSAQLEQGGEIRATASGRFVEKSAAAELAEGNLWG